MLSSRTVFRGRISGIATISSSGSPTPSPRRSPKVHWRAKAVTKIRLAQDRLYYPVSDIRMVRGEGIYLYDSDGNRYIDCASATFNLSLGYGHPAVIAAMKEQADELLHLTSSYQSEPVNELARKLVEVSPKNLTRV